MLTPEEIQAARDAQKTAIFDRFENKHEVAPQPTPQVTEDLVKSEVYWTEEGLNKYKEDLFKSIDNGDLSEEEIEKAQADILSLKTSTREIDGIETRIFVKED